ncbi:MAG: hypothetical protein KC516_02585 [Nanoarchaeota archaeon]|nr:hypothetical protein [Nanoarchaeota archaeon]
MKTKRVSWFNIVLIIVIVACLILLVIQNTDAKTGKSILSFTGHATESSTVSNVTIQKYLSVALCDNLSEGIYFGNVTTLPVTDQNGTHNYDGAASASTYCVNVSTDSNTPVDFCIGANDDLTNAALDTIGLDNETYYNSTSTDLNNPSSGSQVSLTTSYAKSGENIAAGSVNWYRFWLDIPAAQASGDYNNSIYFKGVQTTLNCGTLTP